MNPAKNADEPTFLQGFGTRLKNNLVWVGGAALVSAGIIFLVPAAVMTSPIVVVGTAGAAAYGGYQTGLAASQLGTGAEVNQLGVPTGRQLTPAELGEKAADVTVGGAMIGAGAASALRGRWAAQAVAGAEAQGAAGTWRSWLFRRKAPSKPGPQGNKAPANPSEPTPYGGENPDPWTPQVGSSQPGGSSGAGSGTGAGAEGIGAADVTRGLPMGSGRSPMGVPGPQNAPATISGRKYTGHALDQMQSRGITPSVVEDTLARGVQTPGRDGAIRFTTDQARIIVNPDGSIKTVYAQ